VPPSPEPTAQMRCLCATVRRAGRLLTGKYEEALRPAGMSVSQFELMMTIQSIGVAGQGQLAQVLETDQTTLSRNIKLMLRERWIEESKSAEDARRRTYSVSRLGSAVLAEAMRCWQRVHSEMGRLLPMANLWPVLDQVLDAARQPSPRP